MKKKSILSKNIIGKLSVKEKEHLEKLIQVHKTMTEKMIKVQREYSEYVNKNKDTTAIKARKLADKGFECIDKTIKAKNNLIKYQTLLKDKYTSN